MAVKKTKRVSQGVVMARKLKHRPLMHAYAKHKNTHAIIDLMDRGGKIEVVDNKNRTSLHIACLHRSPWCTHFLCQIGADPNLFDDLGNLPVDYVGWPQTWQQIKYLEEAGGDFNLACPKGRTPLHKAVLAGNFFKVRVLLGHKVNPYATDLSGKGVVHFAAMNGKIFLLKFFYTLGMDFNATDNDGKTPIDCAKDAATVECITDLMKRSPLEII